MGGGVCARDTQKETELCGFRVKSRFPVTPTGATIPVLGLLPGISLEHCTSSTPGLSETTPQHKGLKDTGVWWLASVYPETYAEWPQTQTWSRVWICINLVNTTCPTWPFPDNLPHELYCQALSVAEPKRLPAGNTGS